MLIFMPFIVMITITYFVYLQVQLVLQALKAGAVGTQACEEAVVEIKGVISDLETSAMFATAGALDTNESKVVFTQQCYHIVETAKG